MLMQVAISFIFVFLFQLFSLTSLLHFRPICGLCLVQPSPLKTHLLYYVTVPSLVFAWPHGCQSVPGPDFKGSVSLIGLIKSCWQFYVNLSQQALMFQRSDGRPHRSVGIWEMFLFSYSLLRTSTFSSFWSNKVQDSILLGWSVHKEMQCWAHCPTTNKTELRSHYVDGAHTHPCTPLPLGQWEEAFYMEATPEE